MVKNPANAGDVGLLPGLGKTPGEGNGNPFLYSCLGNPRSPLDSSVHGGCKRIRHDGACMHSCEK